MKHYTHFRNGNSSVLVNKNKPINHSRTVFLDRDGVLINDVNHIVDPAHVVLCPYIKLFLEHITRSYNVILVTNQSFLSRGLGTLDNYFDVTNKFLNFLPPSLHPNLILAAFYHPKYSLTHDFSHWRKPSPGMFSYAIDHFGVCPSSSLMVGDKLTDLQAAYSAEIVQLYYVKSNTHILEEQKILAWSSTIDHDVSFLNSLNPASLNF